MAIINIKYGSYASSEVMNNNFQYLYDMINSLTVEMDYLPLSGGTMTGTIKLNRSSTSAGNGGLKLQGLFASTKTTAPSSTKFNGSIYFMGSDGVYTGVLENQLTTAGIVTTILRARRFIGSTSYNSTIQACVNSSGNAYAACPAYATYTDSSTKICTTAFLKSVLAGSGYGMATYSKSSNGYIKFANGIIIQWGRTTVTKSTTTSVTLPTAFSSTNYNVTTTWQSSINLDDNCNAYNYTTTGFTLYGTDKGANDSYSAVPVA